MFNKRFMLLINIQNFCTFFHHGVHIMKKGLIFILFFVLPLIGGKISGLISGDISGTYITLNQPPFSPPGYVFAIVWTILYLLMGLSSWLVYTKARAHKKDASYYLRPYGIQLAINYAWSPIFFGLGMFSFGSWLSIALLACAIWMSIRFSDISKLAATLQIPYLLWLAFASYLSFSTMYLNM